MSFKCDNCSKGQEPGSKPHRHVETREVQYKVGNVPVAKGREAIKELKLCGRCSLALSKGIPLRVTKRQVAREAEVARDLKLRRQGTKAERREANRRPLSVPGVGHKSFARRKRGRT